MNTSLTKGTHHIGLTVSKLEESVVFFTSLLGWKEVRRNEEYPAIFVSDGCIMVTLWATKEKPENPFNKNRKLVCTILHFMLTMKVTWTAFMKK